MIYYVLDYLRVVFVELLLKQLQTVAELSLNQLVPAVRHHSDADEVNESKPFVVGENSIPQPNHIVN